MRYAAGHESDRRDPHRGANARAHASRHGGTRPSKQRRYHPSFPAREEYEEFDERPARSGRSSRSSRPARNTRPVPDERASRESREGRGQRSRQRHSERPRFEDRDRSGTRLSRSMRPIRDERGGNARRDGSSSHARRMRPDFDPFEPQTQAPPSQQQRQRARGYDELDQRSSSRRRAQGQRSRQIEEAPTASQYSRSSERYVRARPSRGAGRASERAYPPDHQSSARRNERASQANRYSRERYVKQSGHDRATSISQQRYENVRRAEPVNNNIALILAAVAVFLFVILIVRFVAFSGTASEYDAIRSEIQQETTQTEELAQQNDEIQAEIDSMQGLIDQYNKSKK